jgi:hypothetical protein
METQQFHPSGNLRDIVKIAIHRAPAPMFNGVIDEPFHRNIIAIETNTPVSSKLRERYLNFRWGSDLIQNISCSQSTETQNA